MDKFDESAGARARRWVVPTVEEARQRFGNGDCPACGHVHGDMRCARCGFVESEGIVIAAIAHATARVTSAPPVGEVEAFRRDAKRAAAETQKSTAAPVAPGDAIPREELARRIEAAVRVVHYAGLRGWTVLLLEQRSIGNYGDNEQMARGDREQLCAALVRAIAGEPESRQP